MVACLDAAVAHMNCVSQLDCDRYREWWNENVDPFPCETEQRAEESACADTVLF